ncbi:unnamed protein product [Euphydryas editha]|uniref:Uncharacterized protein n=1 Tax=Euphydryas editha TaxID=104508 RepID=A0AAU9TGS1_EUPED|nr:unnamed protein product [Euphydryas editha]
MSVLSALTKSDFKTASDGLLELSEERLRSIMRTEPITDVYHVEQTPFARGYLSVRRKGALYRRGKSPVSPDGSIQRRNGMS